MSVDGMWYVKLADGDVERLTLDELDQAFQKGEVDENSMVLADGSDKWMKLADLLGPSDASAPAPVPAQPAPMLAPVTMPALAAAQKAPPPIVVQAPAGALPGAAMRPGTAAQGVPPTTTLRPVSADLGGPIDIGELQFRSSSRKRWVLGMLGTALVLGVGAFFVVTKTASSASADPAPTFAAAAAQPPAEPAPPAPPPPASPPPQPATNPGVSSVMDPTQRLTEDQKRKVLDADKAAKAHVTKARATGGGAPSHQKDKSSAFTTTGNKFDPLNSSL
jgi:hypothetical protein